MDKYKLGYNSLMVSLDLSWGVCSLRPSYTVYRLTPSSGSVGQYHEQVGTCSHPTHALVSSSSVTGQMITLLIQSPVHTLHIIYLRLGVQIACDGLQLKGKHTENFTCDPLISRSIFIRFSHNFHHCAQKCISS